MTARAPLTDDGSYSTRTCRCGGSMERLRAVPPRKAHWQCPVCGRQRRD